MAPIAGRPFLEILLTSMARQGFRRVVLSLGYMAEKIISHFGDHFVGMDLVYEIEAIPMGTGGAVCQAIARCSDDHVFVFNGDTYLDLEVAQVEKQWIERKVPIIVARRVDDVSRYGCIITEGRRIVAFAEKGCLGGGLINAGCYVFPLDILKSISAGSSFSLETEYLSTAVATQIFDVFETRGLFIDIGIPEDYRRAQSLLCRLHM